MAAADDHPSAAGHSHLAGMLTAELQNAGIEPGRLPRLKYGPSRPLREPVATPAAYHVRGDR
jgi:hypothetical protein